MDKKESAQKPSDSVPVTTPPSILPPIDPPPVTLGVAPERDQSLKKMNKSDWIMSIATIVIAVGTIVSAAAIFLQWREMVNGGTDTGAIKTAAQQQARAAQQFADTANHINDSIGDAVKKLDAQAKSSADSIKAAQEAIRLDQRAWLGAGNFIFTIKKTDLFRAQTLAINVGKSPAINVRTRSASFYSPKNHILEIRDISYPPFTKESNNGTIFPGGDFSIFFNGIEPLQPSEIRSISNGDRLQYFYGEIKYYDIFHRRHWTHFCVQMAENLKDVIPCRIYNDSDPDKAN